jgi:hypothetical protein
MIESQQKKFQSSKGEVIFTVTQLNGMKAMRLFILLSKKIGPGLAKMKGSPDKFEGLTALLGSIDPDDFTHVSRELLTGHCVCMWPDKGEVDSNAGDHLGEIFQGHPFEIGKLVLFALEANFGSFFSNASKGAE